MSLINQMLKDLEKRHGQRARGMELPVGVGVKGIDSRRGLKRRLIIMIGMGILAFIALWSWTPNVNNQAGSPVMAPLAEVPSAAPVLPAPAVLQQEEAVVPVAVAQKAHDNTDPLDKHAGTQQSSESIAVVPGPLQEMSNRVSQTVNVAAISSESPAPSLPIRLVAPVAQDQLAYQKALESYAQGDAYGVVRHAEAALGHNPEHSAARGLLLRQWLEIAAQGTDKDARNKARKLALDGMGQAAHDPMWAGVLVRLDIEAGDLDGARRLLSGLIERLPNAAELRALSGHVALQQGGAAEAAEHYRAALAVDPKEARYWLGLGIALDAQGHRTEAVEAFRRAQVFVKDGRLAAIVEGKLRR